MIPFTDNSTKLLPWEYSLYLALVITKYSNYSLYIVCKTAKLTFER